MMKLVWLAVLLALCSPVGAGPSCWQLEETPHFFIYYEGENAKQLAQIGALAESIHIRLTKIFPQSSFGKTHLVLTDWTDQSNGLATVSPYPKITIYLSSPQDTTRFGLGQMEWLEYVLTHEYAHILQLGAASRIPAALRRVFGSIIISAAFVPPWAYEGWAVYAESNFGPVPGGRLADPSFRAMLRYDLLEDNLKTLDQASNIVLAWPGTLLWYQYGALFFEYLAQEYGQEALLDFFQNLAGEPPAIRFAAVFKNTYGVSLQEAYQNWQAQLPAQVGTSFPREGKELSVSAAQTRHPVWDREGNLFYLAEEDSGAQRLMKYAEGEHFVATWDDEAEFILDEAGELIFAQARWQGDNYHWELYRANPGKTQPLALTRKLRARQPALSPYGAQLAFVANVPPRREIHILDLETGLTQPFLAAEDLSFHSPSWSPDGKTLAVVVEHKGRGRQLEFVDPKTRCRRPVTGWWWQEGAPAWDPSGRYLLFTAQSGDFVNLYAYDLEEGKVRLIDRDAGPAQVSPSGTEIAYVARSSKGDQIYLLPFRLKEEVAPPPAKVARKFTPLPQVVSKIGGYSAWPSLKPHFWLPWVWEGAPGVFTMGQDALGFYSYSGFLGLNSEGVPKYNLNLKSTAFGPQLELNSDSEGTQSIKVTNYWRSVFVPHGTVALGGGWGREEGAKLTLTYSTARSYGLNPYPSRGLAATIAATGLGGKEILWGQARHYWALGRGALQGELGCAWGKEAAFALPGYHQLARGWTANGNFEARWPLALWQRGLVTPPIYLLDSWGTFGLGLSTGGEINQLLPVLSAKLATRITLGFVPTPLRFTASLTWGLVSGRREGALGFNIDL